MLFPVQSQARFWKRRNAFQRIGVSTRVFAYERDYYEGQSSRQDWVSLGTLPHGKYLLRIPALIRAVSTVRREASGADVVYAFGLDMFAVGWLAVKTSRAQCRLVLEVGDIREVMTGTGFLSRMLRAIERLAVKRSDLVVVTSEGQSNGYFIGKQGLGDAKYVVIENRVAPWEMPESPKRVSPPDTDETLTIGYFGVIRCKKSWDALLRATRQAQGRVRVIVRGVPLGIPDFERQCDEEEYVSYGGPFISPDELPEMYADVDMVWIAHLHGESNVLWARANRFFEAGYFGKPVFAQAGTIDGDVVADTGTGMLVDLHDVEGTARAINGVTAEDIARWGNAIDARPDGDFILTDEHEEVCVALGLVVSAEDDETEGCDDCNIVMLLPVSTQSTFWKRHDALLRLGASLKVMAFERPYYEDESRQTSWTSLGSVRHGRYWTRIPSLVKAVPKVLAGTSRFDTLYCFGLDMLALGWMVSFVRGRRCPLVLEVADIRSVLTGSGMRARFFRMIERLLVRRTVLVVCTSDYYVNEYYLGQQKLDKTSYMVLENRLDPETLPPQEDLARKRSDETLAIGYFGLLRCRRSWDFLVRLAQEGAGRIRIVAAGLPMGIDSIEDDASASPWIEYKGTYVSPDDLSALYGQVDLVWTLYPDGEPNQKWARTNRYYEAGYYRKPMIALDNTPDGIEVLNRGIGLLIDLDSPSEAIRSILDISDVQIQEWDNHYDTVDMSVFTLTDEHARLLETIVDAGRTARR